MLLLFSPPFPCFYAFLSMLTDMCRLNVFAPFYPSILISFLGIYIHLCFYLYHAQICICIDIPTHVSLCFSEMVWVCYVHQRLRSMYLCIHVSLQICILLYILIDTLYMYICGCIIPYMNS